MVYHKNLPQPNLLHHYSPTHSEGCHSRKLTKSLTTSYHKNAMPFDYKWITLFSRRKISNSTKSDLKENG